MNTPLPLMQDMCLICFQQWIEIAGVKTKQDVQYFHIGENKSVYWQDALSGDAVLMMEARCGYGIVIKNNLWKDKNYINILIKNTFLYTERYFFVEVKKNNMVVFFLSVKKASANLV